MNVQFTEIKLIGLFVEVGDLYKAFVDHKKNIGLPARKSTRQTQLVGPEVCTPDGGGSSNYHPRMMRDAPKLVWVDLTFDTAST